MGRLRRFRGKTRQTPQNVSLKKSFKSSGKLIFATSETCADLFYATGFFAPDPYAFAMLGGKKHILLNALEIDRGRGVASVDQCHALEDAKNLAGGERGLHPLGPTVACWLKLLKAPASLEVPGDFPLSMAEDLKARGFALRVADGHFWPAREFKTPQEVLAIRKAMQITKAGMRRGIEVLRASKIGAGRRLVWAGRTLTSEILRSEIDSAVLRAGGIPSNTIVAGGNQACDPHERGSGPLRANELIILDIFPRDATTGFYGDLTRTVVRGTASPEIRRLWQTCLAGQKLAMESIRPGVDGGKLHKKIQEFFDAAGYPMKKIDGRWTGFFHGTGHGLGLEVHEEPRFAATKFRAGQVFTVEPGLYFPGLGGVRHEDVVEVTPAGSQLLCSLPKPLEV
jgi:Xaa-Pro aminopeptidase